jgi:hypothetical protein
VSTSSGERNIQSKCKDLSDPHATVGFKDRLHATRHCGIRRPPTRHTPLWDSKTAYTPHATVGFKDRLHATRTVGFKDRLQHATVGFKDRLHATPTVRRDERQITSPDFLNRKELFKRALTNK